MAAYPSITFFQEREGWQQSPASGTIRTAMSSGPDKLRRRFTAAPKPMSGRIPYLNETDLNTFETFYETTLKHGSLSFTATHPRTEVTETFRFVSVPLISPRGEGYMVTADLEVLP